MSDINQGNGTGVVVAAVLGAVVGAGVALLLAPCSGKESRAWLTHRTQELKQRTTNAIEQGKEAIRRGAREIGKDGDPSVTTFRV